MDNRVDFISLDLEEYEEGYRISGILFKYVQILVDVPLQRMKHPLKLNRTVGFL